jgi:LysM repeat protein
VSSLRPLITITLLAAVGVVLYMKINETEPVIPAGVGQWSSGPLEIGAGGDAGAMASTTSPPAYEADAAPPFNPSGVLAESKTAAPAGDIAPSWSPGPASVSEAPKAASTADSSPVARTAEPVAKAPEMPALPETDAAKEGEAKTQAVGVAPSDAAEAPVVGTTNVPPVESAPSATVKADAPAPTPNAEPANAEAPAAVAAAAAAAAAVDSITPTASTPAVPVTPATVASAPAQYATAREAIQSALDRGQLAEALQLLSNWYDDPALTAAESEEVNTLLGQLAGSVIYEGPPAHRLEAPYKVQAGETLHEVAAKYDVPWQLLAKINGVADPSSLQAGQELKVVRGPFSALVDLSERKMTLMLDRRYAGKFAIELDPATTIEEGQWKVDQKLLTPAGGGLYEPAAGRPAEDRSLLLSNPASPTGQAIVLRGPGNTDPASAQPAGRVIRMKSGDVNDVFDILSEKSRVTVRR